MLGIDYLFALLLLIVCVHSAPTYSEDKRDRTAFSREFLNFGKRSPVEYYDQDANNFNRQFMPFGKRYAPSFDEIVANKKAFNREFLNFGKRNVEEPFDRTFMHFGK
ncbi:hypothetical protein M3Y98_00087900 [Aphelenchoides besseyi]|nr:hypothetical protein M3Y98_00087900 [Aphelenchoides besseyi]KAI6198477.1 hypothetical protein M3Y96_00523300 [Aphelenchoides besseyi]